MKGMILQFLPRKKLHYKNVEFSAKYIYPDSIDKSLYEYDKWVLDEITNMHTRHEKLMKDYVFDRVLYWKLANCHNVVIKRDREWFKEKLPIFKELWDKITLLRNDITEQKKFLDEVNRKRRKKITSDSDEEYCLDSD